MGRDLARDLIGAIHDHHWHCHKPELSDIQIRELAAVAATVVRGYDAETRWIDEDSRMERMLDAMEGGPA